MSIMARQVGPRERKPNDSQVPQSTKKSRDVRRKSGEWQTIVWYLLIVVVALCRQSRRALPMRAWMHDPADALSRYPPETVGWCAMVAIPLRRKLWRSAHRDRASVLRTEEDAALDGEAALSRLTVALSFPALKGRVCRAC